MRIQTGSPARGANFFKREPLIQKSWDLLESGEHILLAAPRRVGKTSLMYFLMDYPRENFSFIFLDTESINNENEFFRRIVNKLLKTQHVKSSQKLLTFLDKHKPIIKKVGLEGIEFGVSDQHDYFGMLRRILHTISLEQGRLVIMLDEFPETLENIIADEGEAAGKHFLQSNRELRQDAELSDKVQFIYTGSIGLENIVSKLNVMKTINDLSRLKIPPLTESEAKAMIQALLAGLPFDLSAAIIDYILEKIEWLIPFYIQLVLQELRNLHRDRSVQEVTRDIVDQAFREMLEQRNHFEHWHTRLRETLKGSDYNFVKEILNIACESGSISSNEIMNLSVKYKLEAVYKDLIGSLVYDGYINNHDDAHTYRYNSPILRMWWRQNVAN
ncbi:ATP-binding protein [candidate division KSB1 bacterium]|nr:ATP-binding protein [candidate division KSB1 bacterium]